MNIAIIPARGGSKRIPRKNIRSFLGKPMIGWAIEAASESGLFQHVVVSTDDDEIALVAKSFGAVVPFRRPPELADDYSPTAPVVRHAVENCVKLGWSLDYVCCIYPCIPTLNPIHLRRGLDLLTSSGAEFVYPVAEFAHPVQRAVRMLSDGKLEFIDPESELSRTQDLEKAFHDAGQFYWGKASTWMSNQRIHSNGVGLPIPRWRVVDIDSEEDWIKAEVVSKVISELGISQS